jgi:hypothetical protein
MAAVMNEVFALDAPINREIFWVRIQFLRRFYVKSQTVQGRFNYWKCKRNIYT